MTKSRFANICTWTKTEPIESITIDQLVARYGTPTFIKIDVEGYEEMIKKWDPKTDDLMGNDFCVWF